VRATNCTRSCQPDGLSRGSRFVQSCRLVARPDSGQV
jgi:hypothetical protein